MSTFLAFTQFETTGIVYSADLTAASGALQTQISAGGTLAPGILYTTGVQTIFDNKTFSGASWGVIGDINLTGSMFNYNGATASTEYRHDKIRTNQGNTSNFALLVFSGQSITIGTTQSQGGVPRLSVLMSDTAPKSTTVVHGALSVATGAWLSGAFRLDTDTATTATAGPAAALPLFPLGYLIMNVTGINVKIPYYSV